MSEFLNEPDESPEDDDELTADEEAFLNDLPPAEQQFIRDVAGLDPEEDAEAIENRMRRLDQDRMNDSRREWKAAYGFDHECSCATDVESGNVREVPVCYLGACSDAFDELRRVRAFLYCIATAPTKEAATLKALAAEAFHGR
ncbi:MAG TPA: hypothetical protein VN039_02130 [Nitrospira sp.]|nr:hypothetical protein [Nitrospira sp.]